MPLALWSRELISIMNSISWRRTLKYSKIAHLIRGRCSPSSKEGTSFPVPTSWLYSMKINLDQLPTSTRMRILALKTSTISIRCCYQTQSSPQLRNKNIVYSNSNPLKALNLDLSRKIADPLVCLLTQKCRNKLIIKIMKLRAQRVIVERASESRKTQRSVPLTSVRASSLSCRTSSEEWVRTSSRLDRRMTRAQSRG